MKTLERGAYYTFAIELVDGFLRTKAGSHLYFLVGELIRQRRQGQPPRQGQLPRKGQPQRQGQPPRQG